MTPEELAHHLSQQRFNPDLAHEALWAKGLDLVADRDIDTFHYAAPLLHEAFPAIDYLAFMATVSRQTKGRTPLPFHDDLSSDLQVVAHPHSTTALLVFCGNFHRIGISLPLAHQWLGCLGVSIVYLRDFSRRRYFHGIASIPGGYDATVKALRARLDAMGIRRRLTYGNSSGGFAAVRFALDLNCEAALTLGGRTLQEHNALPENEWPSLEVIPPEAPTDLRRLLLMHPAPPRLRLVYGADQPLDTAQAQNLAGLETVRLDPVAGSREHNILQDVIRRGGFDALLGWLTD